MSIAEQILIEPATRRWTREEYYRLFDEGFFQGQRVQLINGEILAMSPMRTRHAAAVQLAQSALHRVFGGSHSIRVQLPLFLSEDNEPEPDICVVPGDPRDYLQEHPRTALLVVEVSDSTLRFDRNVKRQLYAQFQLPEYWIVNLPDQQLEVFRQPADSDYRESKVFTSGDQIVPISADSAVSVSDLLP